MEGRDGARGDRQLGVWHTASSWGLQVLLRSQWARLDLPSPRALAGREVRGPRASTRVEGPAEAGWQAFLQPGVAARRLRPVPGPRTWPVSLHAEALGS